jgi:hypothetical protein
VESAWDEATAEVREELGALEDQARAIAREYEGRLAALGDELQQRLAPVAARLEVLRQAVSAAAANLSIDLPERPEAEPAGADERTWLFDSARDYMEQLPRYKSPQEGAGLALVGPRTEPAEGVPS